jgi:hypothetical protein
LKRFIDNERSNLFLNHGKESRVEILSLKTTDQRIYKVSDYLNRLIKKSDQLDKVTVEFVDVYYYSQFRKAPDGNYYGTVSFVQKLQGFKDGNIIYGNKTKRTIVIVLPPSSGPYNQALLGWDVYLDDIGVVETEK